MKHCGSAGRGVLYCSSVERGLPVAGQSLRIHRNLSLGLQSTDLSTLSNGLTAAPFPILINHGQTWAAFYSQIFFRLCDLDHQHEHKSRTFPASNLWMYIFAFSYVANLSLGFLPDEPWMFWKKTPWPCIMYLSEPTKKERTKREKAPEA